MPRGGLWPRPAPHPSLPSIQPPPSQPAKAGFAAPAPGFSLRRPPRRRPATQNPQPATRPATALYATRHLQPATSPPARNPQPATRNRAGRAGRRAADPRTRLPAIQLIRQLTGALPPIVLYDQIIATLGPEPSEERVRPYYQAWCARGYNPRSLTWLLEWYTNGNTTEFQVAGNRSQASESEHAQACNLQPATWNRPRTHNRQQAPRNAGPPTSPDDFARWREYQQSVQNGDDPDETKRRLGL